MASKHGVMIDGAQIYVTHFPCYNCFKVIANVGIKIIDYFEDYRIDPRIPEIALRLGIQLKKVEPAPSREVAETPED